MNEQILKVSVKVLVAEFLQRPCELPATAARLRLLTVTTQAYKQSIQAFAKLRLGD
jgi:hypothetical protein